MNEKIYLKSTTYSLIDVDDNSSNLYYEDIIKYTDILLRKANQICGKILCEYQRSAEIDKDISIEESLLEFLSLGVLWDVYLPYALNSNQLIIKSLYGLTYIRNKSIFLKKYVDYFRGVFSTLLLRDLKQKETIVGDNILLNFKRLLNWLRASGEFTEEVKRLEKWYQFFFTIPAKKRKLYLEKSIELAKWFTVNSREYLGIYTSKLKQFLAGYRKDYNWKENIIFCGRKRVEYHLNMVGAEILNRVYRKEFLLSRNKAILLPVCMRLKSFNCPAEELPFAYRCLACSPECNVNRVRKLAEEYNYNVYIIPHRSILFSSRASKEILGKDIAIIGVACLLHLIQGGWLAKSIGIPAQCVLLDYSGCEKHWHKEGIITNINFKRLEEVMCEDDLCMQLRKGD